MSSGFKSMALMNLGEAIKNSQLLESELGNISRHQDENIASLAGMLYSIPRSVTKNREFHNIFTDGNFKEDDSSRESQIESISSTGDAIRKKIMENEEDDYDELELETETEASSDSSEKTYETEENNNSTFRKNYEDNTAKGKNVNAKKEDIDNFALPFIPVVFGEKTIDEYNTEILPEKNKKNLVKMMHDIADRIDSKEIGKIKKEDIEKDLTKIVNVMSSQGFVSENTSLEKINDNESQEDNAQENDNYEYDLSEKDNDYDYDSEESNEYDSEELDDIDIDNIVRIICEEYDSGELLDNIDIDDLARIICEICGDLDLSDDLFEDEDLLEDEDEDDTQDSLEDEDDTQDSLEDENETQDFSEDGDETQDSLEEGDETQDSLESLEDDLLKSGTQKSQNANDEKNESNDEDKKKADEIKDDEQANELREKAISITNKGSYGIATRDGIEELSELLNELLSYSSGTFRKNKPIEELVRNFNSMKSIESQLVGNEESLKITPEENDFEEIAKSAGEPTISRAVQLSMQQTYADKVLAINRFEYSDKIETLIRNALYDVYNNNKNDHDKLTNEKAKNIGKILLPLLRTRTKPENYNYDFQYDVLKEIIRQEEFYNKYEDEYKGNDEYNHVIRNTDEIISIFVLLRYLKTIFNRQGGELLEKRYADSYVVPTSETFKKSLEDTFNQIIQLDANREDLNGDELSTYTTTDQNTSYFVTLVDSFKSKDGKNNKLKESLNNIDKLINEYYTKVKGKLYKKPRKGSINITKIKASLGEIHGILQKDGKGSNVSNLASCIKKIKESIGRPGKLMACCGQADKLKDFEEALENAREAEDTTT